MKGRDLDAKLEESTNIFLHFFLGRIVEISQRWKPEDKISIDGRGERDWSVYV